MRSSLITFIGTLAVLGFIATVYNAGVRSGKDSCKLNVVTKVIEQVKKHEEKKKELLHLDDDALIRRYCHWVYGIPYADCVRTVKPIP